MTDEKTNIQVNAPLNDYKQFGRLLLASGRAKFKANYHISNHL